jgi:hydrogenase maturation protease
MIYVLGFGNVLMGDDGFGPAVIRAFDAAYSTGPGVEVVDVGTPGLDLMPWFSDAERLVIVDTVNSDCAPGTLKLYDKGQLLKHLPKARVGPHEPGVKEALLTLDLAGRGPRDVLLVGIVPQHVGLSIDLTPVVNEMVAAAAAIVATALRGFGVVVQTRAQQLTAQPWWMAEPSHRHAS